jgi:hypothetical protein
MLIRYGGKRKTVEGGQELLFFHHDPTYLRFFVGLACDNTEPAKLFAVLLAVELFNVLDASFDSFGLLCFGLRFFIVFAFIGLYTKDSQL